MSEDVTAMNEGARSVLAALAAAGGAVTRDRLARFSGVSNLAELDRLLAEDCSAWVLATGGEGARTFELRGDLPSASGPDDSSDSDFRPGQSPPEAHLRIARAYLDDWGGLDAGRARAA